jgi:PadR family transcriptional regulator PadR
MPGATSQAHEPPCGTRRAGGQGLRAPPPHKRSRTDDATLQPLCRRCYTGHVEPPFQDLDLTPKMAAVIKIFLEDTQRPRYGLELMRLAGQPSGTLYPNLAKFEGAGWLAGGKEDIDPHTEGRPARRFYRITGAGARAAHNQLAALSERYRPPATNRSRLAPQGGTA